MEAIHCLSYEFDSIFQSSSMECEETHQLSEPTYVELLNCSFKTSSTSETEKPNSPNAIEDSFFNDRFMERLLQMEAELGAELGLLNDINGNNLGDQESPESQENVVTSPEVGHSNGLQEMEMEVEMKCSLFDLLLTGARAVEASNWPLASNVIATLTNILSIQDKEENPLANTVLHFTRGLQYKSRNAPELLHELVPSQTVTMSTFQMLLELSPYVKFAQFTANQAILEATRGEHDIHIIDLDIMEGSQWPPLMADLASRKDVSMRITAITGDPQNAGFIQQTGRRLVEFANSIGLLFKFDEMAMEKGDNFDSIEVGRLSPKRIVLVEEELFNFARVSSMSFGEFFSEAFQHYTALSDSLLHSFSSVGYRLVEREIMGPRILDCLRKFPIESKEKMLWKDGFSFLKSLKPIPMSPCNVSQAKLLTGLFGRGYWVQHENCRLSLCWKSKPLTTASVWMPANMSTGQ
ncbi:hypothetical protein F0562_002711 [Nyssa sinensis]|uniref:Uncharacterized protein n=1 Tax=Nyssa sinensis TaxID=561372 RepID=A0A5J5BWT4_9ASTE|nr:hypothetical protein F0562_002711 [Nyssa sinensis]